MRKILLLAVVSASYGTMTMAQIASTPTRTRTTELKWYDAGLGFGIQVSPVYGNLQKGEHSTYVKFPAGTTLPMHTHTDDYYGVVISGNLRHPIKGQPETNVSLPPGSHWSMPANVEHVTECEPGVECIVMLTQKKPFDFKPTKK
ncbi:MAG: DUF4437 domain-containing protein [Bacteroidetes bacterium]|nr:DUF4437 domain-containing protein [Bacteroidota bacterium]